MKKTRRMMSMMMMMMMKMVSHSLFQFCPSCIYDKFMCHHRRQYD
jgi:hypothetical protein